MRHKLDMTIRLEESDDSVKFPKNPFQLDEDFIAVRTKLMDLEAAIRSFEVLQLMEFL